MEPEEDQKNRQYAASCRKLCRCQDGLGDLVIAEENKALLGVIIPPSFGAGMPGSAVQKGLLVRALAEPTVPVR